MFNNAELQKAFNENATLISVPGGKIIISPGQYVNSIPIVVKGCIRIIRQGDNGEEAFLYHILPGESCAMSLSCCTISKPSEIKAIAEEDTEYWSVPLHFLDEWYKYKEWKDFISKTYEIRFNKLLQIIDQIAFQRMDIRLWNYLLARAKAIDSPYLNITHEEIAQELNIQREAATRLIRKLKELKYIKTGRNQIKILKDF